MLKENLQKYIEKLKKQRADILEVLANEEDKPDNKLTFTIDEHLFLASENIDRVVMNLESIIEEEESE